MVKCGLLGRHAAMAASRALSGMRVAYTCGSVRLGGGRIAHSMQHAAPHDVCGMSSRDAAMAASRLQAERGS